MSDLDAQIKFADRMRKRRGQRPIYDTEPFPAWWGDIHSLTYEADIMFAANICPGVAKAQVWTEKQPLGGDGYRVRVEILNKNGFHPMLPLQNCLDSHPKKNFTLETIVSYAPPGEHAGARIDWFNKLVRPAMGMHATHRLTTEFVANVEHQIIKAQRFGYCDPKLKPPFISVLTDRVEILPAFAEWLQDIRWTMIPMPIRHLWESEADFLERMGHERL